MMGLDDNVFGIVCSNPLPTVNQAYFMIIREDRHRSIARGKEEKPDAVSFAARMNRSQATIDKTQLLCSAVQITSRDMRQEIASN